MTDNSGRTAAENATPRRSPRRVAPRRQPLQQRSVERAQQIIEVAARLLHEVGLDDLTTILIARECAISVGTLYHYFPNKHAILYAMGERWLREVESSLEQLATAPLQALPLEDFVERLVEQQLRVYRSQLGILPLVQAMYSVPELRELDQRHDKLVIDRMAGMLGEYGAIGARKELERLARAYLELTHALLLVVVNQRGLRARRTLDDLKRMTACLIKSHL